MVIKEIELITNDLDKTASFYHHVLGMPIAKQSTFSISFVTGYSLLKFQLDKDQQPNYHFAFLVPANKIEEAYNWVKERTAVLPFSETNYVADFSNWNAHAFYFHDPHKNILEFIAHHDLPNHSDTIFSIESVIGICEIGLPVVDVTAACAVLHQQYGIPYFVKGPRLADFSVMGDDEGLLIVTKKGRGWLPTGQPAAYDPQRVVLQLDGASITLSADRIK